MTMESGGGDHRYERIDDWATLPDTERGREFPRVCHPAPTCYEGPDTRTGS